MSLRRVTALLVLLFSFFTFVVTQDVLVPNCTSAEWNWTFNSLNQNPCTVLGYLVASCIFGGRFSINPLAPGNSYPGPDNLGGNNLCECNSVVYSLLSACGACQGGKWITWSDFIANCTEIFHPSEYPNPVPSQIRVPLWALIDVTKEGSWNSSRSYAVGDTPEQGPGSILGPLSVSESPTPTPSSAATSSPSSSRSSSNTAAIVGGVVGSIAAITIVVAAIFYLRRRRSLGLSKSAESTGIDAFQPHMDEISRPSAATMRLYLDEKREERRNEGNWLRSCGQRLHRTIANKERTHRARRER